MAKIRSLSRQPQLLVTIAGLALVVILGVLDYVTGPEISVSILYLLPISLITWLTNRRGGIILAIISAIIWLISDLTTQKTYSHFLIPYWNAVVRLLFFLIVVYLESNLRNLNQDLEDKIKNRTALLEAEVTEREKFQERLQQYTRRLEVMHEIDRSILTTQSPEASAQTVVHYLRKLLPCERTSVTLLDFVSQKVIIIAAASDDETGEMSRGRHISLDTFDNAAEMLELLRRGEVQLVPDLRALALVSPSTREVLSKGFRSSMSVPLIIQEELIGILNLLSYEPNTYTSGHFGIAREVADHLGITIQQARLFDQLRTNREQLQALSQRLLEVQEAERRRIARELHDEIGQVLTSVGLTLEMASQISNEPIAENLRQAHVLVVELMDRVSRLSLELRPALLDDLGLLPALLWFLERFSSQTKVIVVFKHNGLDNTRFAPEIETAVYRIVQESLTNVARHAKTQEAKLALWFDQGVLGIQIEDEGIGFNQDLVLSAGYASGLLGMRERVSLLNGKLIIESGEGLGTRLLAEIPVNVPIIKGRN